MTTRFAINTYPKHISHVAGYLFFIFCLFSGVVSAKPLLSDPKFVQLSTEQGLSQDSVYSVLHDKDGFLWVGTYGGLNRYDGYRPELFAGPEDQLRDASITALFQDSKGYIWVGTESSGVFRLDVQTGELVEPGVWTYTSQADYKQSVTDFLEDKNGNIWIALLEEVIRLDSQTLEATTMYVMDNKGIAEEHAIRTILLDDDILYVGRSDGFYGKVLGSGTIVEIDHLQGRESNDNTVNVKLLNTTGKGELLIGTVEGLVSFDLVSLGRYVRTALDMPDVAVRIPNLNIWAMLEKSPGRYYVGTDLGLYEFDARDDQLQHILAYTDSRLYLSDDDIVTLTFDPSGNLWMGSQYDGLLYWSSKSTLFTNVSGAKGAEGGLSSNDVWSLYQGQDSTLWIGTRNGLNSYSLVTGEVSAFVANSDSKAVFSQASIENIVPAGNYGLWLQTSLGLQKFDTETFSTSLISASSETVRSALREYQWGATSDSEGRLWFVKDDGIFMFDPLTGVLQKEEKLSRAFNPLDVYDLWLRPREYPDSLIVSVTGGLMRYNLSTKQLSTLHALPKEGLKHFVAPDSFVKGPKGMLWVLYPTYGLFGLDSVTLEQVHKFDRKNLLPTNSVYGLELDADQNIWMSSHQGLLKLYPENHHVQRYAYEDGLSTLEFNQYAHARLTDNRLVYGSMKGITVFDPRKVTQENVADYSVKITNISLSSRLLQFPFTDLNNSQIVLEYNDVGLQIGFSSLTYNHQNQTRYTYQLLGDTSLTYPSTQEPYVNFPKLSPGEYEFRVTASNPITGEVSTPASVMITVRYAPWSSPVAYSLYAVLLASILAILWTRRLAQNHKILTAHWEALNSKNRLSLALTASNSNVWEWREADDAYYAPRLVEELGVESKEGAVPLATHLANVHKQDRSLFLSRWQSFVDHPDLGLDVTYRMVHKSGEILWYRDAGSLVSGDVAGQIVVAGTYTNMTESLANQEKVRLFGEAFKHTRDWVVILDNKFRAIAANQALSDAFGIDETGNLSEQIYGVFHLDGEHRPRFWTKLQELGPTQHWKGEDQLTLRNGKVCNVLVNTTSVSSVRSQGEVDYYLLILSDISEQKGAEQELRRLANFDSLTGLPNRTLLLDRIKHAIDHASREQSNIGLFFIDLDRFKQVNDSLGHEAGDELLRVVSQRLTNLLRQDDTVARLGGDEFVVMVEGVADPDKLSVLAQELISVLEAPIQLGNQSVSVSSSIGIALFPNDAATSEELLRNADLAMYHAKEMGRNNFQYFTAHMNKRAQERLVLENKLKSAHLAKEFINYYQPIISSEKGAVVGYELLMRWPTESGMIPPGEFIPVAEELGLIEDMTWDALERAMPVLKSWQQGGEHIYLSVNLSARHLEQDVSVDHILGLLSKYDLPTHTLRFEITESALMKNYKKAKGYLETLSQYGFVIALDDFGTGYSSLKYLKEFPINVLKVDKSFVDDIGKNRNNEAIILTTLRMAESLNMYCVAEGIEQELQILFFKQYGCQYLQGYFFSKPVPEEDSMALLSERWDI